MTTFWTRPLIFIAWLFGRRQARYLDAMARQAAYDAAVFEAIGHGELLKPLPKRMH